MPGTGTTLTVINETDIRGQAMLALIKQYISFSSAWYGFKSIGSNPDIAFPVLFVEPKSQVPELVSTVKYHMRWAFAIYWYVRESRAEDAVTNASLIGEQLKKLFSNNALGDINSGTPTKRFRQYANPSGGMYWLDSEMKGIQWSTNYLDADPQGMKYERAGRMMLDIMDIIQV